MRIWRRGQLFCILVVTLNIFAKNRYNSKLQRGNFIVCKFIYTYICMQKRRWHPTPVLLPGKSHGWRSLVGCSPWGRQSRTRLSNFPFTFHFHVLEKEMAPHSSTFARKSYGQRSLVGCSPWGRQSRTQLSDFTFTFHFHVLEKEMATHSSVLAWRFPGTGKPGGLPSMGLPRVGRN